MDANMHKNTLWFIFAILCIYFALVFSDESTMIVQELVSKDSADLLQSNATALEEEPRTRRRHRHHLYSMWSFYGLAVAYLIKIKVVVVAFFVGSAVYLGLRYLWPHKCGGEIYREGSIVLDHPPSFAQHDHVSLSSDHNHSPSHYYDTGSFTSGGHSSFDPYSAYSGPVYTQPEGSFTGTDISADSLSSENPHIRRKRSAAKDHRANEEAALGSLENLARQMVIKEEQIGEFMLRFLGLDTNACRRRFICEMEFKSRTNPLTAMAFRVIGSSIFAKYTNNRNPLRKANSFQDCAAVNAECVFIENNVDAEDELEDSTTASEAQVETTESIQNEQENENNLTAESRRNFYRKRFRGVRHLKGT